MTLRFLVDAQLPPALARFLAANGHEAVHVFDFGGVSMSDKEICQRALETSAIIVTKDQDFLDLMIASEQTVRVLLIRFGNTRKYFLLAKFGAFLPEIVTAFENGESLVELR